MNKVVKIAGYIFIGILAISILAAIFGDDKKDKKEKKGKTTQPTETEQPKSKQWTEVYKFKGNGMKKSPVFELTGGNARVKYSYKAPGELGMGMFALYIVDEGDDIMKTGGIPEVMSQKESEESESSIQKGAGRYYLNLNASGDWTVSVEEEK